MLKHVDVSDLAASPRLYPLRLSSPTAMAMLELTEDEYRAASFLDDRLLTQQRQVNVVPLDSVRRAVASLDVRLNFIFHIGHVGSTLLARLIGAHPDCFALREPSMLRALADQLSPPGPGAGRPAYGLELRDTLALLGRRWRPEQTVLVKATSVVNEIAIPILELTLGGTALMMYSRPRQYMQCILGGPNSRLESMHLAGARFARLNGRLNTSTQVPPRSLRPPRSEGEIIAMNWLSEMSALEEASRRHPERIRWLDFDQYLMDPRGGLKFAFTTLGLEVHDRQLAALVSGPLMHRYSKDPQHAYDAELRRDVLAAAAVEHATEIERGLAWLSAAIDATPGSAALRSLIGAGGW